MHRDCTVIHPIESIPTKNGIVVLRGYGLVVRVERGRLLLKDGVAMNRRQSRFTKATCGIKRLVLLGHTGIISLEAIRWIHDIGAAVVQIDADGQLLFASSPFKETYSQLRRKQANAYQTSLGTEIIRKLLSDKLASQADLTERIAAPEEAQKIHYFQRKLQRTKTLQDLRIIESRAASAYWGAWKSVEVNYSRRDKSSIPAHWRSFNKRYSPLTSTPRNAANPANAILNYLYAILEAETRIACLTVGLDPGMGLLHRDQANRDSLALDIMEPARPQVDRWFLEFLKGNTFSKRDFFERRDGTVRLSSRITTMLAESSILWARAVGPVVEWVAKTLHKGSTTNGSQAEPKRVRTPTPLTESNRSAGRDPHRRKSRKRNDISVQLKTCRECGSKINRSDRKFCCRECWETYNEALVVHKLAAEGPRNLARLRASGKDPNHGGETAKKRGQSNARRARERIQWEKENPDIDLKKAKTQYQKEILPRLATIPLSKIMRATGFSKRYASMIRRDLYTPHPMHFKKLEDLIMLYNDTNGG